MTAADSDFDIAMMRLALEEARKALPSPNPPVGAVIVAEGGEAEGFGERMVRFVAALR